MFKIILLLALLFPSYSNAAEKQIAVSVNGMVCGFCAQGITKKFRNEPAVEKVDVSLENKLVTISLKDGQTLADTRVESLLKESGYNVEKIAHITK